jgi:hypothetical protein
VKIRVPLLFPRPNMDNTKEAYYVMTKPMMCFKDEASTWRHQEWLASLRREKMGKRKRK